MRPLNFNRPVPTVKSPEKSIFGRRLPGVSVAKNVIFGKEYRIQQSGNEVCLCFGSCDCRNVMTSRTELRVGCETVGLIVYCVPHLSNCTSLTFRHRASSV